MEPTAKEPTMYELFGEAWEEALAVADKLAGRAAPLVLALRRGGYSVRARDAAKVVDKAGAFLDFLNKVGALRWDPDASAPSAPPPGQEPLPLNYEGKAEVRSFVDDDGSSVLEFRRPARAATVPFAALPDGDEDESEDGDEVVVGSYRMLPPPGANGHSEE